MAKVVINTCFGGFSISAAAVVRAREISGDEAWGECVLVGERYPDSNQLCTHDWGHGVYDVARHDAVLVQVVEELGEAANGRCSKLRVVTVPKGTMYRIDEHDGQEHIETQDTIDWAIAD